jgi:hypothetical protein
MRRSALVIILIVAIVALVRLWPDKSAKENANSSASPPANQQRTAATSAESTSATLQAPVVRDPATPQTPAVPQRAPIRIDVRVPATVHSGESFEASVDIDANGGIQQLAFSVAYNKAILQLVGSTEGTFVQQHGVPAQFGAQEPSDGTILVNLDVNNGAAIAGAGSVAILQFQALKPGTSPVTVDSITFVESGRPGTSTTDAVHQGLVTVD